MLCFERPVLSLLLLSYTVGQKSCFTLLRQLCGSFTVVFTLATLRIARSLLSCGVYLSARPSVSSVTLRYCV